MATALADDTRTVPTVKPEILAFAEQVREKAAHAFDVLRETGTITAAGTVGFIERVPGEDAVVNVNYPGPFRRGAPVAATVARLDGTVLHGKGNAGRYLKIFNAHPDITTVSHVHTPHLGAWAQTHRTLPISYVPVQRFHLARELPVYIDRRQEEQDFILQVLADNPHTPGIIEANGGATVWGWKGLDNLAEFILLLEEGAAIQIRAAAIGGSRAYGPGVLRQQWKMSNRYDEAKAAGLLPVTDLY